MQAVQKITAVPCGAVSSDRSQMGPLLYGRLSFSAENSPSLLNVFKNLLQILQVASCEIEKVQPQSWFCLRVCMLGFFFSTPSYFFSALPPPLSIFDPQGYPAAKSVDLGGPDGSCSPGLSSAPSTQHRGAPKAIRWVGARGPERGGNWGPLGSWGGSHGGTPQEGELGGRRGGEGTRGGSREYRGLALASLPSFPNLVPSHKPE